ncbi:type VI secretion system tube protein TssD [Chitinophagaceae bacterium MMS25-I14]
MAYNAELKFNGGGEYKVLDVNYNVARTNDPSGRVASDPSNALVSVTIEANEKSEILESMLNGKFKPTKGEITFNKSHEEGIMIKCSWENGYIIHHEVRFDAVDSHSMRVSFVVSAEKITYGSAEYDGKWPV